MSLSELQSTLARAISTQLRVALPATIESYDAKEQRASVKPSIMRRYIDGQEEELPVIHAVPVVWPAGTNSGLSMPLSKGDGVLLVFSDRAMDTWLENGGPVAPEDRRQHDLNDAIAIPGLLPFSKAEGFEDFTLYHGSSKLVLKKNGDVEIQGKLTVSDDVIVNGVSLKNHTHKAENPTDPLTGFDGFLITGSTGGPN